MKKLLAILLACVMLLVFIAACTDDTPAANDPPAVDDTVEQDDDYDYELNGIELEDLRIALVAHGPESIQFDGSFNEGAWNGIVQFLEARSLNPAVNANFFQSIEADNEARVDVMIDAIETWGAHILILPGFHFAASVYTAANLFPDTMFVVLDTRTDPGPTPANVVSILYAEEQSGFLAGYAVVMEGYRNLGFMGGVAVPAVVRFGHGFIEGADFAAQELGLSAGDVSISYHYIGAFAPSPEVATMAASWYAGGTDVIFAAAGGAGASVISAAEDAGTWMVGVDVDQSGASDAVLTSAMKALAVSVVDMLTDFVSDDFQGGADLLFDASNNGVALPMDTSRFSNFTSAQFYDVFAQIANGSVVVTTELVDPDLGTDPNLYVETNLVVVNFIP